MSLTTQTPQQIYDNQHPVEREWKDFSYDEKMEYLNTKFTDNDLIGVLSDNDCGHLVISLLIDQIVDGYNKIKKKLDNYNEMRKKDPSNAFKWAGLAKATKEEMREFLKDNMYECHSYKKELINTVMDNGLEV